MRLVRQITFEAKNDMDAFAIARERLGRDAVILSSRTERRGGFLGFFTKNILVVTAGLLEEERDWDTDDPGERMKAFQKLLEVKNAVKEAFADSGNPGTYSSSSPPPGSSVAPEILLGQTPGFESKGVSFDFSGEAQKMAAENKMVSSPLKEEATPKVRQEMEEIRGMLHDLLARLPQGDGEVSAPVSLSREGAWNGVPSSFETSIPPKTEAVAPSTENSWIEQEGVGELEEDPLVSLLLDQDVSLDRSESLVEEFRGSQIEVPFQQWLASLFSVTGSTTMEALQGEKILFVGPTGVGKTTTIAKLAAILSLWEKRSVLLLTADTYRIAAVEQLKMYARILGVPFGVVQNPEDVEELLGEHEDVEVVLIDTAGRCQHDKEKMAELEKLYEVVKPDAVHLVLAANMKNRDMKDVFDKMPIPLSSLIFTKLDETLSFGALVDILLDLELPMSFLTAGQNVPNDIDVADPSHLAQLVAGGDSHAVFS